MSTYAQYRLPFSDVYTRVEQSKGEPQKVQSCTELNGKSGFVIAPFMVSDEQPILLIHPDIIETYSVELSSYKAPDILKEELHRDNYAIDFANFHSQLENDFFRKIVLSRCADIQLAESLDCQELFLMACQLYPRLFIALVSLPDGTSWLTATPEILLEGVGQQWRTIALAGTMQLQGDELKGEGENVRWSTKNIQEQRYVATYIAECLEQFSLVFSEEGPRTVRAANLVHLRSDFTFTSDNIMRIGNLLDALHPTPAVCGLPKQSAFRFIMDNEHTPRQYYSGFMGPLGLNDETHIYVSLRCMQIRQDWCRLYAGGGLLKDSQLEQEWQETEAKMQTIRNLLVVNA
jgi:isochorismate synthase